MLIQSDPNALSGVLFDASPLPIAIWDAQTLRYLEANAAMLDALGYTREAFLEQTPLTLRPPGERERFLDWLTEREAEPTTSLRRTGRWTLLHREGDRLEFEIAQSPRFEFRGRPAYLVTYLEIKERQRTLDLVRMQNAMLDAADLAGVETFSIDLRTDEYRPSHFYRNSEAAPGTPETFHARAEMARRAIEPETAGALDEFLRCLAERRPFDREYRLCVNGEVRWLRSRTRIVHDAIGTATHVVGVTIDTSDRRLAAEAVLEALHHDLQTGLPNRVAVERGIDLPKILSGVMLLHLAWIASPSLRSEASRVGAAQAVVHLITQAMPRDSTVVRYADNVFAVMIAPGQRNRSLPPLAKKLAGVFERPVRVGNDEIVARPTIGVAIARERDHDPVRLCREGECALEAARRGGETIVTFDETLAERTERRATIERQLRTAIARREIAVAYQPILSLATGRIVAAEALMRWSTPGLGTVSPSDFMEIAEESGMIVQLGEWVLRQACVQVRHWQQNGYDLRIAVNVSARQLGERDFVRIVRATCDATGVDPRLLELELTERTMLPRGGLEMRNLEALRRLGVRASIDDFGTGFSNLNLLKSLPVDTVKLDRSFVAPLADDDFQREVARSIIALAHRRQLNVVGEGVETPAQLEHLRAIDCDEVQGYLLGRPVAAADLLAALQSERLGRFAV